MRKGFLSITLVAALCGGCAGNIDGNWKSDSEPKNQRFYLSKATFRQDKTFNAVARQDSLILRLRGTYEFDGTHLRLKTPGWPDRIFTVLYRTIDKTLELSSDGNRIRMKKQ